MFQKGTNMLEKFLQAKVLSLSLLISTFFFLIFIWVAATHLGQLSEFMNTKDWIYLVGTGASYVWILNQTWRLLKIYLPYIEDKAEGTAQDKVKDKEEDFLKSISSFGSSLVIIPFILFIFLGMTTKGVQDQLSVEARLCKLEGKKDSRCEKVIKYYENVLQKN